MLFRSNDDLGCTVILLRSSGTRGLVSRRRPDGSSAGLGGGDCRYGYDFGRSAGLDVDGSDGSKDTRGTVRHYGLAVNGVFQALGRLERDLLGGCDLDRGTCGGITARAGRLGLDFELTKAGYGNFVALDGCISDRAEDSIDDCLGLSMVSLESDAATWSISSDMDMERLS